MKIRPRGDSWQLDCGKINGRRVQLSFATKEAAEAEKAARKGDLKRAGHSAFAISDEERVRYLVAREKLKDVGATIEEAVEFFVRHARPQAGVIELGRLAEAWREAKREEHCRVSYLRQIKCSSSSLVARLGERRPAHEIMSAEIEGWLKANEWAAKTWNVYLGDVSSMFSWAMERGHVTRNPATEVKRKRLHDAEIQFLSTAQCEALLRRAAKACVGDPRPGRRGIDLAKEDYRDLLPIVVLGLFCGLRPERELGLLDWQHVSLENKLVIVTGERAKTRRRRTVDLSPNALAWLSWWTAQGGVMEGRILPKNFENRWKRLRTAAGVFAAWPHDAVRHTFATMYYAHHRDEAKLQVLMGHESASMLHQHYRGLVAPAEAALFWALMPGDGR